MRDPGYLVVKGCAGIGNRLFTLASAIRYARDTGRTVVVDWRDGVFAAPGKDSFSGYFELKGIPEMPVDDFFKHSKGWSVYPSISDDELRQNLYDVFVAADSGRFSGLPGTGRLTGRLSMLREYWKYRPGNNFGKKESSLSSSLLSLTDKRSFEYGHSLSKDHSEKVVVYADYWPHRMEKSDFKFLDFSAAVKEKAGKIMAGFGVGENTVGVHVRWTDKQPGKGIETLLEKLQKITGEGRKVFLSTDNVKVEEMFRQQLGPLLMTAPKYFPKTAEGENLHHFSLRSNDFSRTEQIYLESLTDLYILSKMREFYYQGNSSFSLLATMYSQSDARLTDWLAF